MSDAQYHLKFDGNKAAAVDAYLEYRRIVGDDDEGELFTPDQYDAYKKDVLPKRLENRIYTSWTNASGMDCKQVGPETPCFCEHRYKQHKTDFATIPDERPILVPCKVKGCKCTSYHYIPLMGGQAIRCTCKHLATDHSESRPYQCKKNICQKCAGFKSCYTCGCGESYMDHEMVVETRDEREARGHPVGHDTPYAAMGGLTGFSSLADGYMRLDPSGRGAPSEEFLAQPITSSDHAYLRGHVPSIQHKRVVGKQLDVLGEDMAERMSAMRRPGEKDDMDYFERRYQEKQRAKKGPSKQIASPFDSHPDQPRGSAGARGGRGGAVARRPGAGTPARKSAKSTASKP